MLKTAHVRHLLRVAAAPSLAVALAAAFAPEAWAQE